MNESKIMTQLHAVREKNYERMKRLSVKDQIRTIQAEAEPIKKRLLEKMRKREVPTADR
ncbi:MAG: hypothetical protein HY755_08920 [Nitrospirae bacterium]|nr:hypothetical protein [Nitrospirota bacterium]